jgi:hypothetical protein
MSSILPLFGKAARPQPRTIHQSNRQTNDVAGAPYTPTRLTLLQRQRANGRKARFRDPTQTPADRSQMFYYEPLCTTVSCNGPLWITRQPIEIPQVTGYKGSPVGELQGATFAPSSSDSCQTAPPPACRTSRSPACRTAPSLVPEGRISRLSRTPPVLSSMPRRHHRIRGTIGDHRSAARSPSLPG